MNAQHDETPTLYRHPRRPDWGLAILDSEDQLHRRYQFQDGELRTIRKGFYQLLEPVDRPLDEQARISERLEAARDVSRARKEIVETSSSSLVSLPDQVGHFKATYPGGFADPRYTEQVRGEGAGRRLKRQRDPLIEQAREALAEDKLRGWLEDSEDMSPMREALLGVLKATDLVKRDELEIVASLTPSALSRVAEVLLAIWEDENSQGGEADPANDNSSSDRAHDTIELDHEQQFDALVAALTVETEPRWCLPTTILAALFPDSYPPVRHNIYREQARWMAPRFKLDRTPSGRQYQRLRAMTAQVRQKLAREALEARDLFDVWDFMWETLRPKAKEALAS
ncbi:MAG TPA: hypothetical protein PK095_03525 [Myxococcota bacterium]|nr:hypothetical protein [Myxococcota bacterium]